jgi:hypothetical protein
MLLGNNNSNALFKCHLVPTFELMHPFTTKLMNDKDNPKEKFIDHYYDTEALDLLRNRCWLGCRRIIRPLHLDDEGISCEAEDESDNKDGEEQHITEEELDEGADEYEEDEDEDEDEVWHFQTDSPYPTGNHYYLEYEGSKKDGVS